MGTLSLLFFRGHGAIPCLIRLATWRWWLGQRWEDVPAHVAIWDERTSVEWEAVVFGIRKGPLSDAAHNALSGLIATVQVEIPDYATTVRWLNAQVGRPYGFAAVAITGAGIIAPRAADRALAWLWRGMAGGKGGRSVPLDCSELVRGALAAGGAPLIGRADGLPMSPNDVLLEVSK